ncbi:hypothetical protein A1O7_06321 [Cladophialophora yegresii CBS 114405]|uniref:Uncharacterized protein n=1 Tax=Cladophialophora yegresii CBS 114405 TaxID=1182544 RepID=W9W2Y4_9EURO|nr:uncharacterized protein A1O7_06321 [Cladophialophora yegresii CBS 114405]EXJ58891.1 hypothetical protein A1O7_06321 [Cladophialophora yegresii CBS 114405]
MLRQDARSQELAQRLGMEMPEYIDKLQKRNWPYARDTDRGQVENDVSQRGQLQRRRATPRGSGEGGTMESDPSTMIHSQIESSDQSTSAAPSDMNARSPGVSDARDHFRVFCSGNHTAPSIEIISIFGEMTFLPVEVKTTYGTITLRQQQLLDLRIPEYLIQPLLFDEERCPLAAVYTDFRDYGRRQIAEGQPVESVLGNPKVDLALYFRDRQPDDPHTPATWACEFMRLLTGFDTYVALAYIFTYARFMRWSIAPSAETYALLPEAMRPTPMQRLVRHHPGVDLPIFPELRDGLIQDMRDYIIATQTLGTSVNWEHRLENAVDIDSETGKMTVSESFATHVCDLSNWSISQRLAEVFPELRGVVHEVEHETIPVSKADLDGFLRQRGVVNPASQIVAAG